MNNKDEVKEKNKEYYDTNRTKILEQKIIYERNNREQIIQKHKEYYIQNKEKIKERKSQPFLCECGCTIQCYEKARHKRTKKYLELLESKNSQQDTE